MSHTTVLVFTKPGQTVEELLAPYSENIKVEPYIEYTKQEAIDEARKTYSSCKDKTDEECWKYMAENEITDSEGNIYSTYNPKSKWDWWQVGGRFSGLLFDKEKDYFVDEGYVKDIQFVNDAEAYEHALKFWDVYVEGKEPPDDDDYDSLYKKEYYKNRYKDKETYARYRAQFSTWAVVTPDGEWHECGRMGWFACSDETDEEAIDWYEHYKERFLDTAQPDWYVTVVDYHI